MRYSLDEIETFLAVMELGTVTAAAARLNLSKSVVSKRIADFESALGAALFRRNAGRIAPTDAALRLAAGMRPALAELRAAAEGAAQTMGGPAPLQGTLAISAPMSFGILHLGPILARFAEAHPRLDLRIDFDDRARDLAREGFDIAIRIGDMRDAHLMQRKLCEGRMIACASPLYLKRHGTPAVPADLAAHQVIGYSHLPDARLWQFHGTGRSEAPQVTARLTLNNGEAMRDMALAGLGLAMLPDFIVAPALREGRLLQVLAAHETRILPIHAVWPPISPIPVKLRALIEHLAAALAGGRPWNQPDKA